MDKKDRGKKRQREVERRYLAHEDFSLGEHVRKSRGHKHADSSPRLATCFRKGRGFGRGFNLFVDFCPHLRHDLIYYNDVIRQRYRTTSSDTPTTRSRGLNGRLCPPMSHICHCSRGYDISIILSRGRGIDVSKGRGIGIDVSRGRGISIGTEDSKAGLEFALAHGVIFIVCFFLQRKNLGTCRR